MAKRYIMFVLAGDQSPARFDTKVAYTKDGSISPSPVEEDDIFSNALVRDTDADDARPFAYWICDGVSDDLYADMEKLIPKYANSRIFEYDDKADPNFPQRKLIDLGLKVRVEQDTLPPGVGGIGVGVGP
jgi:hypothetical protein